MAWPAITLRVRRERKMNGIVGNSRTPKKSSTLFDSIPSQRKKKKKKKKKKNKKKKKKKKR
jgi:uncharacterized metal-binding protein